MAALLAVDGEDEMQVRKYVRDCMQQGIPVMAPHINLSGPIAIPEGESVRIGFRSIAGIKNCANTLCEARGTEPFTGLGNLVSRMHSKMKVSEMEKLIRAGCCDEWGSRLGLVKQVHDLWKMHNKQARKKTEAVPLFDLEDAAESQEDAPMYREEDRVQMELELLAGCYREDVDLSAEGNAPTQISVTCWDLPMVDKVIQVVKKYPGRTPLHALYPSENRHGVWVQLGKVQQTKRFLNALKETGVEIRA